VVAVTNPKIPAIKGLLEQLQVPALRELAEQQVRFAPPAKRLEQLARAEKLLTRSSRPGSTRISSCASG